MFEEEYRQIEGYEYSISNFGNVRNDKTGRIMSPRLDTRGYLQCGITKNSKRNHYSIHRLVAIAFLENPDNLLEIDHINQIKTDNRVENLRWCSRSNNCRNRKKQDGCSSNYQGVGWHKQHNKWKFLI